MNNRDLPAVDVAELRLVDAAAAGDHQARRLLFERFRDVAFHVALRLTGRREDALDVVQDAYMRAFAGLGGFQREAGFKTWLLRIVSNRALDVLRARRLRVAAPLDAGDDARIDPPDRRDVAPGAALERAERAARLRSALEKLPPEQRAVFALYAEGELTYAQIAEALGVPIGTVMSRLFHARQKLKHELADLAPLGVKAEEPA